MNVDAAFLVGQQTATTATFRNDADELVDPATVTFKHRVPSGTETSYAYGTASEVTKVSTGIYKFTAPAYTVAGTHVVRAVSTSPTTANEAILLVSRSRFTTP